MSTRVSFLQPRVAFRVAALVATLLSVLPMQARATEKDVAELLASCQKTTGTMKTRVAACSEIISQTKLDPEIRGVGEHPAQFLNVSLWQFGDDFSRSFHKGIGFECQLVSICGFKVFFFVVPLITWVFLFLVFDDLVFAMLTEYAHD